MKNVKSIALLLLLITSLHASHSTFVSRSILQETFNSQNTLPKARQTSTPVQTGKVDKAIIEQRSQIEKQAKNPEQQDTQIKSKQNTSNTKQSELTQNAINVKKSSTDNINTQQEKLDLIELSNNDSDTKQSELIQIAEQPKTEYTAEKQDTQLKFEQAKKQDTKIKSEQKASDTKQSELKQNKITTVEKFPTDHINTPQKKLNPQEKLDLINLSNQDPEIIEIINNAQTNAEMCENLTVHFRLLFKDPSQKTHTIYKIAEKLAETNLDNGLKIFIEAHDAIINIMSLKENAQSKLWGLKKLLKEYKEELKQDMTPYQQTRLEELLLSALKIVEPKEQNRLKSLYIRFTLRIDSVETIINDIIKDISVDEEFLKSQEAVDLQRKATEQLKNIRTFEQFEIWVLYLVNALKTILITAARTTGSIIGGATGLVGGAATGAIVGTLAGSAAGVVTGAMAGNRIAGTAGGIAGGALGLGAFGATGGAAGTIAGAVHGAYLGSLIGYQPEKTNKILNDHLKLLESLTPKNRNSNMITPDMFTREYYNNQSA